MYVFGLCYIVLYAVSCILSTLYIFICIYIYFFFITYTLYIYYIFLYVVWYKYDKYRTSTFYIYVFGLGYIVLYAVSCILSTLYMYIYFIIHCIHIFLLHIRCVYFIYCVIVRSMWLYIWLPVWKYFIFIPDTSEYFRPENMFERPVTLIKLDFLNVSYVVKILFVTCRRHFSTRIIKYASN